MATLEAGDQVRDQGGPRDSLVERAADALTGFLYYYSDDWAAENLTTEEQEALVSLWAMQCGEPIVINGTAHVSAVEDIIELVWERMGLDAEGWSK